MQYTLSNIDFNAPRAPDQSCMGALLKGLEYEVAHLGDPELPVRRLPMHDACDTDAFRAICKS